MPLPIMTPEQRSAALVKARLAQQARSAMIASIRAGELSVAEVLQRPDDIAQRTRIGQVLRAVPGQGPVAVGRLLAEAGVDAEKRIGQLNAAQRARLLAPQG